MARNTPLLISLDCQQVISQLITIKRQKSFRKTSKTSRFDDYQKHDYLS